MIGFGSVTAEEEHRILQQLNAWDQQENYARAAKTQAINELPEQMRAVAMDTEDSRQREYERRTNKSPVDNELGEWSVCSVRRLVLVFYLWTSRRNIQFKALILHATAPPAAWKALYTR